MYLQKIRCIVFFLSWKCIFVQSHGRKVNVAQSECSMTWIICGGLVMGGRGNPTEIADYSLGIFTPIQIRVIWPTHQYWAFRESKMSNPTNDILSQCCESYRCFKAIHNNCWWNDERGANVSCTTKRGANSGNNANADYKIFIMLSQPQHSLLQMSSSTQFCTKN